MTQAKRFAASTSTTARPSARLAFKVSCEPGKPAPDEALERHPKYGKQFQLHSYSTVLPANVQGIRRYLPLVLVAFVAHT
jgi:hypothetical protein